MPSRPEVLGERALNRALLARQMLLRRERLSVPDALERLVGLQAQDPVQPYVGLWSRLEGFRPEGLGEAVQQGQAVRMALMRSTIHLVTRRDALRLRPLVQPAIDRGLRASYGRRLDGVDPEALAAAARAVIEEKPTTTSELGRRLAERWPEPGTSALANAARAWLPMVQLPPRGVWGRSGRAIHAAADTVLHGRFAAPATPTDLDTLVLRYLAGFGPAGVADVQQWSGLTGLREVIERLRARLRAFHDAHGRALFDVPDAPRPGPDAPAPLRLVAGFDNLVLSHADRTRIIPDRHRPWLASRNGMVPGTVLVDGFVAGMWRSRRGRGALTLTVELFQRVSPEDEAAAAEQAESLAAFLARPDDDRKVELAVRASE